MLCLRMELDEAAKDDWQRWGQHIAGMTPSAKLTEAPLAAKRKADPDLGPKKRQRRASAAEPSDTAAQEAAHAAAHAAAQALSLAVGPEVMPPSATLAVPQLAAQLAAEELAARVAAQVVARAQRDMLPVARMSLVRHARAHPCACAYSLEAALRFTGCERWQ